MKTIMLGTCGGSSIHGESWDWVVRLELYNGGFHISANLEVHQCLDPDTQEMISPDDPEEAGYALDCISFFAQGERIPEDIRPTLEQLSWNMSSGCAGSDLDYCLGDLERTALKGLVEAGLLPDSVLASVG